MIYDTRKECYYITQEFFNGFHRRLYTTFYDEYKSVRRAARYQGSRHHHFTTTALVIKTSSFVSFHRKLIIAFLFLILSY